MKNKKLSPLRKIEYVVCGLSNAGFMSTQLVHLECGHEVSVSTATTYRARCYKCRAAEHPLHPTGGTCPDCIADPANPEPCDKCGSLPAPRRVS